MKKCKECGGSLRYNPSTGNLICTKCGSEKTFAKSNNYELIEFYMDGITPEKKITSQSVHAHCPSCGAVFSGKTLNMSDVCEYCGSNLVVDSADDVAPEACIPFAFDLDSAKQRFKEGLKKKWFLPRRFKKAPPTDRIESVYIPAYLCNAETSSSYKGRLYDEEKDNEGNRKYSYQSISGVENCNTKNLVVECSSKLTQSELNQIKPYDFGGAKKFTEEFLLGYSVEYFDKKLDQCKKYFKELIESDIRKNILSHYSYDGVDYLRINTEYKKCTYSKIILPSYMVRYKFGKKEYTTFMNGQTGKVGGNLPRALGKILAFALGIGAVVGLIAYFIIRAN